MNRPAAASLSAEEIVRRSGSSFASSFRFLSPPRRKSMAAVYAFCRVVDDAADLLDGADARESIAFWREELEQVWSGCPATPVGRALALAAATHGVRRDHLLEVVRGVEMDLAGTDYATFEQLSVYCARVASAVGLACLPVLGATEEKSGPYAQRLGVALQFTNILRDLSRDARAGRVYVPRQDLERFGVLPAMLEARRPDGALAPDGPVARLLAFEGERARSLFGQAEEVLPPAERRALLPARIMGAVYRELLEAVLRAGAAALSGPPARLSRPRRLAIALRTWFAGGKAG